MSLHPHRGPSARRAVWVGGLLFVLAGLFGMHGLETHRVAHAHIVATNPDKVTAGSDAVVRAGAGPSAASLAHGDTPAGGGTAALCAAVLVVALITVLRLLLAIRAFRFWWLTARPVRGPAIPARALHFPVAPSLSDLSICRC